MATLSFPKSKKRTRTDDDSDSDTDNELFLTKDNWPKFIVVKSASEERLLSKLSPFAPCSGGLRMQKLKPHLVRTQFSL